MSTHDVLIGFNYAPRAGGTEKRYEAGATINAGHEKLPKRVVSVLEQDGVLRPLSAPVGDAS